MEIGERERENLHVYITTELTSLQDIENAPSPTPVAASSPTPVVAVEDQEEGRDVDTAVGSEGVLFHYLICVNNEKIEMQGKKQRKREKMSSSRRLNALKKKYSRL